jgi:hypothetical protein
MISPCSTRRAVGGYFRTTPPIASGDHATGGQKRTCPRRVVVSGGSRRGTDYELRESKPDDQLGHPLEDLLLERMGSDTAQEFYVHVPQLLAGLEPFGRFRHGHAR